MGFIIHFYVIFWTNLLTGGPVQIVVFAYFSVSRKMNIKQNKIFTRIFLGINATQETWSTSLEVREASTRQGRAQGGRRAPHPRRSLVAPLTEFLRLYILIYPENIQEHHETLFPPPQPSVPVRSHLGSFSGTP